MKKTFKGKGEKMNKIIKNGKAYIIYNGRIIGHCSPETSDEVILKLIIKYGL